jgi:hypothetical protein
MSEATSTGSGRDRRWLLLGVIGRGFLIHCPVLASARSWGNLRGGDHGRWMCRCPIGFDLEDSIAGASSLPSLAFMVDE